MKTDNGGLVVTTDVKVSASTINSSNWATRLSQIKNMSGDILICTYSLPNLYYIHKIFEKRSDNITILMNLKFVDQAIELKSVYPRLKFKFAENTHAKLVLIYPNTVWLSSANFGKSDWFETSIGIKNIDVYQFYMKQVETFINKNKIYEM